MKVFLRILLGIGFCLFTSWVHAEYDPPAVYLTWQRSPDTTMTVHWITGPERSSDLIEFQKEGEANWKSAQGVHQPMPFGYAYLIHTAEITGLSPDTIYSFRAGADGVSFKFRTMPSHIASPIRFAVGGDVYHGDVEILNKMNRQVAKKDPSFVVIGGDLAYNNLQKPSQSPDLWPRWMDLLMSWKKTMVTSNGLMIPIIPAIGNHEIEIKGFGKNPEHAPFFYALFAMPGKQGYNVLDFGQYMSFILLDSGHTHPIFGRQTQWLFHTLKERAQVPHQFVTYHIAAFPSVRPFEGQERAEIRKYWIPILEQSGVKTVFENHDHAYKRTKLIKAGKPDPNGILYLGDGGWAVEQPRVPKSPATTWYLEKALAVRSFILVTIDQQSRNYKVFDDEGALVDEISQKD